MIVRRIGFAIVALAAAFAGARGSHAAQLRVEPVLLELNAPAAAGSLTLRHDEDTEIVVQTRVMRWSQADGKETLEPTTDVVASPPTVKLSPGADYVVRVVRVSKRPVTRRRKLPRHRRSAAQHPAPAGARRQSSDPAFDPGVLPQSATERVECRLVASPSRATSSWSSRATAATSACASHRCAFATRAGATVSFGNGLVGYALGRSSMSWVASEPSARLRRGRVRVDYCRDRQGAHQCDGSAGRSAVKRSSYSHWRFHSGS